MSPHTFPRVVTLQCVPTGLLPLTVLSRQRQKFSTIRSIVLAQNLFFPTRIVKLIVNSALFCHLRLHTHPKAEGTNSPPFRASIHRSVSVCRSVFAWNSCP